MTVVLTGATGLIGQHLLRALENTPGYDVVALGRRAPAPTQPSVRWVTADLANAHEMRAALPASADIVIHLAQSAFYREFPERALDIFNVNVASTAQLLDWSRSAGVRHFILASSGGVSVASLRGSFYLASKASAELLVESYARQMKTLVLRFFFVYGAGQKPGMLVPRLIETVRAGQPVELTGTNGTKLNPIHVDDAVNAIMSAVESQVTGCIDVAGPEVLTVREMAEAVGQCLGRATRFADNPASSAIDVVGDITAMSEHLLPPRRRFSEAVSELVRAWHCE